MFYYNVLLLKKQYKQGEFVVFHVSRETIENLTAGHVSDGPLLFCLAGKEGGEKGRWIRLARPAGAIQASPDFRSLRAHILTLQELNYAPPVTVLRI